MNKVQQLINKALSTSSEQEAISCLTLARKQYSKEYVEVTQSNTINTLMAQKSRLNNKVSHLQSIIAQLRREEDNLWLKYYEAAKALKRSQHSLLFFKRLTIFMFVFNLVLALIVIAVGIK